MKDLNESVVFIVGGSHEPMISPALRSTATVNPVTPSPPSRSSVSKRSLSVHRTPTAAAGTHSASFTAALRKLAKQAEEPRVYLGCSDSSYSDDISPVPSAAVNPRTPSCSPRRASAGTQRSVKLTPVVTIAPNEAGGDLWRNEGSQQFAVRPSSHDPHSATLLLKQEKAAMSPVPTHYLPRNTAQELSYSSAGLQRPVQQIIHSGKRSDGYQTGFHPYLSRDAIQPLPTYPGLDTTSCFYPAFLRHLPLQPSVYSRYDDPYFLSIRTPFLHLHETTTISPLHTSTLPFSKDLLESASVMPTGLQQGHQPGHADERKNKDVPSSRARCCNGERVDHHVTPGSVRDQEPPTEESRRLREAAWESDCSRRTEIKQKKNQDVNSPPLHPKHYFNRQDGSKLERHPYFPLFGHSTQPLHKMGHEKGSPKDLSYSLTEMPNYISFGRIQRNSETKNTVGPVSFSSNRLQCLSPSSSSLHIDKTDLNRLLLEREAALITMRETQNHLQKTLNKKANNLLGKKTGDTSRPPKDREDRAHLSSTEPLNNFSPATCSREFFREMSTEPQDSSGALDFRQQSKYENNRAWDKRGRNYDKATDKTKHSLKICTSELPRPCRDKSISLEHNVSGMGSMPDLLTQVPYYLRVAYNNSKQESTGSDSTLQDSQEQCLDLSITSPAGNKKLRKITSSRVQNTAVPNSMEPDGHRTNTGALLIQRPVASNLNILERKLKQAKKRGLPFNCNFSAYGTCKRRMSTLVSRLTAEPPVKLDNSPGEVVFLELLGLTTRKEGVKQQRKRRRLLGDSSPDVPHLQKSRPTQLSAAKSNSQFQEKNGAMDTDEKKQFLAHLQLKPLAPFQREASYAEYNTSSHLSAKMHKGQTKSSDQSGENQSEDIVNEDEMEWQTKWKGIASVFETYQEYTEEKDLEESVLQEQLRCLKEKNDELNCIAHNLSSYMQGLEANKQKLETEREHHQAALDCLKKSV
ncbi:genetic suppressor element 1-like [Acipenser oxyrinchus oxyrinchus]|uniref:Genetic suppressor element 1-like n=1 Tax=Acipenser oxyrinchus oxyrinchus TaxID=40147 RepID=A0AAD8GDU0_ACIOX|nr:genetic suppressor element 1-like [Acipenser oxyrinchus oxyrinchus]